MNIPVPTGAYDCTILHMIYHVHVDYSLERGRIKMMVSCYRVRSESVENLSKFASAHRYTACTSFRVSAARTLWHHDPYTVVFKPTLRNNVRILPATRTRTLTPSYLQFWAHTFRRERSLVLQVQVHAHVIKCIENGLICSVGHIYRLDWASKAKALRLGSNAACPTRECNFEPAVGVEAARHVRAF